jgi:hypothetical protein
MSSVRVQDIETELSDSGERRCVISKLSSGFFTFRIEEYQTHQHLSLDETYSYWLPVYSSGLYETLAEVHRDAHAMKQWKVD